MPLELFTHPEEFRYLILALQRQGSRRLNRLFSEVGLTHSQAEVVEVLGVHGPISTKEVGQYLVCESGSPSRLLDALVRKGISVSAQSTEDKRLTLHALSPKGRELLTQIKEKKVEFESQLAAELRAVSEAHGGSVIEELVALVSDPELKGALQRRFPHLYHP
ncbi:winged helix DNA-binding protein [Corynebacterium genitalium ATCC 33030]|uniref:Transcriptional regulator, MarR family n=1 Tax=Corynebacterium genitalium ATCC 33030 TaxID=585529 RepID=D7W9N6_9CORY|nr:MULTISPECIES: winged helix DNA-binding protein [Corynebacterium]MCQ4618887.1 winged helix DNA-binding protein [Corynebacterium pseudogenitalium]EFK55516.1 transcriptional regulator, MarR family [Corynebacterium genitalium ATCC 33030]MCQ4621585.1 winged helix DNA-binding protein [Corynebacterium sp. CCUG 71335]MCQ4623281.1 winged helix DNA-binding protein [Corynebacterium sp. CCUG 70398]MCQ4624995.1 winged helix DNA-binding protein [Corynebacterium sp. CCUG 69979]